MICVEMARTHLKVFVIAAEHRRMDEIVLQIRVVRIMIIWSCNEMQLYHNKMIAKDKDSARCMHD